MTTETAGSPPATSYGCDWYVRKHRHEHEAAGWDESRLLAEDLGAAGEKSQPPIIASHLLIKFITCVVTLTAALGVLVSIIR